MREEQDGEILEGEYLFILSGFYGVIRLQTVSEIAGS